MSLSNNGAITLSLMGLTNDVLGEIFKNNAAKELLTLRHVSKRIYFVATTMIFRSDLMLGCQMGILRCWSFNPNFLEVKFDSNFILNVVRNPKFRPPERVPGLLVISSQKNIQLPIEKMADCLISKLEEGYPLYIKSRDILTDLIHRLPDRQLEKFLDYLIKQIYNPATTIHSYRVMKILEKSLTPSQKESKLEYIIDRSCDQLRKELKDLRRIGIICLLDNVSKLTEEEFKMILGLIPRELYDHEIYKEATFCLMLMAPKLNREQTDCIYKSIQTQFKTDSSSDKFSGLKVLRIIANSLTHEQTLNTVNLIILWNDQKTIFRCETVFGILTALAPKLTSELCLDSIRIILNSFDFVQNSLITARQTLSVLIPKLTKDEIPCLLEFIKFRLNHQNWNSNIFALDMFKMTHQHFSFEEINDIINPVVENLENVREEISGLALDTLEEIASRLSQDQIASIFGPIYENLSSEDPLVCQGAFYRLIGIGTRLTAEQISCFLELFVNRFEKEFTFWRELALTTLSSLVPMLNNNHRNSIFEPLFNTISRLGNYSEMSCITKAVEILTNLAPKFTEQQFARFLEWHMKSFEDKAHTSCDISRSFIGLLLMLNKEKFDSILPRIIKTQNPCYILTEIAPRLSSENAEKIFLHISELSSIERGVYGAASILSALVPHLSEKQCSSVLEYLLHQLTNADSYFREEAAKAISNMLLSKKLTYDQIESADILKYPEGILIHHMAIWLKQMEYLM